MATVQLADIFEPTPFARLAQQAQIELNRFIASGVSVVDATISAQLQGGAKSGILDLPSYDSLGIAEPNYSTDNPASSSTPSNISSLLEKARSASRNESWSAMDLARELNDPADPVTAITNRIGAFWATDDERRLIQSYLGVLADNEANDSGDMLIDIYVDAASPAASTLLQASTVINAAQTLGDHKANVSIIAMHSKPHADLQAAGVLETNFETQSDSVPFETYLGYRVVVDDSLPVVGGTFTPSHLAILFAAGSSAFGTGRVQTPSELDRKPSSGDGGGETVIHSRVHTIWHPFGFSFLSATVAGQSPTYAELALAANWNRIAARKNAPIAFIRTN